MLKILFLITCLIALGYGFNYTNPIQINVNGTITKVIYSVYRNNLLAVVDKSVLFYNMNATIFNHIYENQTIHSISTNMWGTIAYTCKGVIKILKEYLLFNTITVPDEVFGACVNNYEDTVVYLQSDSSGFIPNKTYQTVVTYKTFRDNLLTNFTVDFMTGNVVVDPYSGNLVFNSFILLEPAVYVGTTNVNGLVGVINTTKDYPLFGIAVTKYHILVNNYYGGIDIYTKTGDYYKTINAVGMHSIAVTIIDNVDYIIVIDSIAIYIIDWNNIYYNIIDHNFGKNSNPYVLVDATGDIIAYTQNTIKIWHLALN